MKLLSLIFCFMVISQAFTACMDKPISMKSIINNSHSLNNHDQSAEKHAEKDSCSPFCQCTCCATPTVAEAISAPIQLLLTAETVFNEPSIPGFLEISLSVWQPPQLV